MAAGERADGERVGEVEFEEDGVGGVEGAFHVVGHVVPDPRVGHVDRAEEVGRWFGCDPPQERGSVVGRLHATHTHNSH